MPAQDYDCVLLTLNAITVNLPLDQVKLRKVCFGNISRGLFLKIYIENPGKYK